MATGNVQANWDDLHDAARAAGACIEPQRISTVNHVHADWRRADGAMCRAEWLQ